MRSELNYAGKNLSEFGMWFDNSKVYKKPAKRFMGYDIPERNGTLYQSENKFNNVVIEFDCFIKDNFDQNYHDLVNFLNSFDTYQKLINSYNTDMFRMALFHEAIEVDTGQFLKDGRFKLFFDCKPQEYYADGAEFERIAPHSDIYTGNPAELVNEGESSVISLRVALEPIQAGSGEPSPSNVRPISGHTSASVTRTGKNLLKYPYRDASGTTSFGITYTVASDGTVYANGIATDNSTFYLTNTMTHSDFPNTMVLNGNISKTEHSFLRVQIAESPWSVIGDDRGNGVQFSIPNDGKNYQVIIRVERGQTVNNLAFKPMLRLASDTDSAYEPYTSNTYTIDLNGTRYGGTVDLATGVLTVDTKFMTYNGSEAWETINIGFRCALTDRGVTRSAKQKSNWLTGTTSSEPDPTTTHNYKFNCVSFIGVGGITSTLAEFKALLASNPLQIVYELATPQTVQLTAQQISLLTGINYISSSGDVTVTTSTPLILNNPSPMTAKPVFKFNNITAPFTVSANGETIISFQNAIRLVKSGFVNNMFFNATGTNLIMQKQGTPNYEETSFLINSGWLPAGRYFLATMPIGNLEVTSMNGTHLYSSGGLFTLSDITQVKVWYVITPNASTPQNFNYTIYLRPRGTLYVDSELMDCYMLDGDTAYSFNECVSLPKDFLQLDERTVMTMTSGAVGFIAPNWWRL